MSRRFPLIALCLLAPLAAGCVERRYVILTDVPGAVVFENNKYVGPAPVTRPFLYYGDYQFTIVANGYQTIKVTECIRPPWYEYFPLDFIAENLLPFWHRDVREFHYKLEPAQIQSPDQTHQRSEVMRQEGKGVGIPPAQPGLPNGPAPGKAPQNPGGATQQLPGPTPRLLPPEQ